MINPKNDKTQKITNPNVFQFSYSYYICSLSRSATERGRAPLQAAEGNQDYKKNPVSLPANEAQHPGFPSTSSRALLGRGPLIFSSFISVSLQLFSLSYSYAGSTYPCVLGRLRISTSLIFLATEPTSWRLRRMRTTR